MIHIKRLLEMLIGIVTSTILFIVLLVIVNEVLPEVLFDLNQNLLIIILFVIIGVCISFLGSKKKYFLWAFWITMVIIIVFKLILGIDRKYVSDIYIDHTINWKSIKKETNIPFYVNKSGFILIKAMIDEEVGYVVFDTGADISFFNEKFNKNNTSNLSNKIEDAQGIMIEKEVKSIKSLSFGDIAFKDVKYYTLDSKTWDKGGIFYKRDSILGILGNNVINEFVWDIDMIEKRVSISEKLSKTPDSRTLVVPLIKSGFGWRLPITINGYKKTPKLDSGSNSILSIRDTIPLDKNYLYPIIRAELYKTVFSNRKYDQKKGINNQKPHRIVFANMHIGSAIFDNVEITDNTSSDLLGIPFFWSYERVILDFHSRKAYFINPVVKEGIYHPNTISYKSRMSIYQKLLEHQKYFDHYFKEPIEFDVVEKGDSDKTNYTLKGKIRLYGTQDTTHKTIRIDSIQCLEGVIRNGIETKDITRLDFHKNTLVNPSQFIEQL